MDLAAMVVPCERFTGTLPFNLDAVAPRQDAAVTTERLQIAQDYPGLWRVHEAPPLYLVDGFATDAECDALVRLADPLLRRSLTDGGETQSRTSRSCHLAWDSPPCPSLLQKVQALTRLSAEHFETPQVARYEQGERYTMHFDSQPESGRRPHDEPGGQRVCTCLIYLNDVQTGGHTRFNRLGVQIAPRKGAAVVFFPGFVDGRFDPLALHEALPAEDTKFVCQVWVRQRPIPAAQREFSGMGHRLLAALHENG